MLKQNFKRALVSTSNKDGLVEFLKPLVDAGLEVVSTGGTSKFLRDHGIKVTEVADVTGFPEMMDGRVRTLHPFIHMGLLARSYVPEDFELLKSSGVTPFDLVVVNLYPFAEAVKKNLRDLELIDQIDVGGPSMLRAAAKSFERLTVVCDPADYAEVIKKAEAGEPGEIFRRKLAAKVFSHCSQYDALIATALGAEEINLSLNSKMNLRYGENPHQKAGFYKSGNHALSLHHSKQLQGKELSYNNLMDLEAAINVLTEFANATAVIIKHNTPCGVAEGENILSAYKRAFDADSISAFGGILALNRKVDMACAETMSIPFLECIIAPSFDEAALKIFSKKKNLRILQLSALGKSSAELGLAIGGLEYKSTRGGFLVQETDGPIQWPQDSTQTPQVKWKILGEGITDKVKADLLFSMRVAKHVKSNAIVIARGLQTLGICGGQTNRIDSVKMALERATKNSQAGNQKRNTKDGLILASDAFFPFRDSVDLAALNGVKWIIQPGGSLRDQEVEQAAREQEIGMVITGRRHFKH